MGSEAVEGLSKLIEERVEIKWMNIKAVTIQNWKAARDDAAFYQSGFAMTFELTKEVDKEKLLAKAWGDNRPMEEEFMGKKYLKSRSGDPCIYFCNKMTFTIATPESILAVSKAESEKPGRMADMIKSTS